MTWILVLLCLAIAGRELYLAFERKRPGTTPELADLRARLTDTREEVERLRSAQDERFEQTAADHTHLTESLGETDARISSLIGQINDRMVPEVNTRLTRQRETIERLGSELAGLRGHLIARLDQAVAASLGADPVDTVAGALAADATAPRTDLGRAFERLTGQYGLRVELADPAAYRMPGSSDAWQTRYYLSGRSPRGLERDFIDLLRALAGPGTDTKAEAAQTLLGALEHTRMGGAQIGPLVIARTPHSLICGVLPLADLQKSEPAARIADPLTTAAKLQALPPTRLYTPRSP
ncbi:hypothetical protein [Actinomadura rugatobispora]|uniref:DNA recombination protein RmuC n=1 Tax=Actinomadura rugatobispora TaxID=1994 RepID=A0ABW1AAB6_9ACTN|nr:hypothetical protein GCM10010200_045860 [Actinomadura rugatobispora]